MITLKSLLVGTPGPQGQSFWYAWTLSSTYWSSTLSAHIVFFTCARTASHRDNQSVCDRLVSDNISLFFLVLSLLLRKVKHISASLPATGHGFVSNSDYFWTRNELYPSPRVALNSEYPPQHDLTSEVVLFFKKQELCVWLKTLPTAPRCAFNPTT